MGRDVQRVYPASSRRQAGRDASAFANTDIKNTDVRPVAGRASTLDVTFVLFVGISLSLNVSVYMHPKKLLPFLSISTDSPIDAREILTRRKLSWRTSFHAILLAKQSYFETLDVLRLK